MDIANAKQVKIRVKGVNAVIEKQMNRSSRNHFKTFVAKFLDPGTTAPLASISAAIPATHYSAQR